MDDLVNQVQKFFAHKKVGILGFGLEGQSTYGFLKAHGIIVAGIMDQNPNLAQQDACPLITGESHLDSLSEFDIVIRSAGISPLKPQIQTFLKQGGIITSQLDLFCRFFSGEIIAITGTFGKGTTLSLLSHILQQNHKPHTLAGNIGVAMLDTLVEQKPLALLELSSFQLMDFTHDIMGSIILSTTSEHLDWHRDVKEYRKAKGNLVKFQSKTHWNVSYSDDEGSREISHQSQAQKLTFGQASHNDITFTQTTLSVEEQTLAVADCQQAFPYMLGNMAAATLAAMQLGLNWQDISPGLKSFTGLELRNQLIKKAGSLSFRNDSYATRPEATIAASEGLQEDFYLILGGSEKHADFSELKRSLQQNQYLKGVALIGYTAERLWQELDSVICTKAKHDSLEAAFAWCTQLASKQNPTTILLSPACASFGLFPNYKVRGQVFNQLVNAYV
jgi:UDP-N-acetylmuramoylalanine--D-glutamate ligase